MPYKDPEKRREANKKWYQENKAKKKEKQKQYNEDNKEKIAEYNKQNKEKKREAGRKWYQENKEQKRQYYEDNKEHIKQYHQDNKERIAEYNQSPAGKKIHMISSWKNRLNIIHDNFDELYEHYINTHSCDVCHYVFDEHNRRCLDHDHDTGLFRQILCHRCNVMDNWKKIKL